MKRAFISSVLLTLATTLAFPATGFAIEDLEFESRNTDIPVFVDDHRLQDPFGYGQPAANYPTFTDIDNDGDLDLFIGSGDGTILFYRNNGGARIPDFVLEDRTYLGIDRSQYILFPTFADTDGDGDMDLYFGEWSGHINYYKNRGSEENADLVSASGSESSIDVKNFAAPDFVDIDNDGDLDLFVGSFEGKLLYYENIPKGNDPQFLLTDSTYLNIDVREAAVPRFIDIDGDEDLDLFLGSDNGKLAYYKNNGSPRVPEFSLVDESFIAVDESYVYPAFGDIDDDGDLDIFLGNSLGNMYYFENTGSATNPNFEMVTDEYFYLDVGDNGYVDFEDIDDDGDEDLFMLNDEGQLYHFENTGSAASPKYELQTRNFADLGAHAYAFKLADLDKDNDTDIVVGHYDKTNRSEGGHLTYLKNIGSVRTPKFLAQQGFFEDIDVGEASTPELFDYENDGDLDLFIGAEDGSVHFYRNTGTKFEPNFAFESNSFEGIHGASHSQIHFTDIDSDGDGDAILGNKHGRVVFFENVKENIGRNFLEIGELTDDLGFNTVVTALDIDYDSKMDLFVTSIDGNLHHFKQISTNLFPPEDVTNLNVEVDHQDIMTVSWNPSLNSEGDLHEYRFYQRRENEKFTGSKGVGKTTSVTIVDFNKFYTYGFKVTAKDNSGLESQGVEVEISFEDDDYTVREIVQKQVVPPATISEYCAGFPDVRKEEFSVSECEAVEFVKDEQIFEGNDDGTLAPERPINRAEVTKVLIEAFEFDLEDVDGNAFTDVPKEQWFAPYVVTAREHGIVEGYPDRSFRPGQTINKVELLKIVLETAEVDFSMVDIGSSLFSDIEATEDTEWFLQYTNFAHENGLLDVVGNVLEPNEPMTRLDVMTLLHRLRERGLAFQ